MLNFESLGCRNGKGAKEQAARGRISCRPRPLARAEDGGGAVREIAQPALVLGAFVGGDTPFTEISARDQGKLPGRARKIADVAGIEFLLIEHTCVPLATCGRTTVCAARFLISKNDHGSGASSGSLSGAIGELYPAGGGFDDACY